MLMMFWTQVIVASLAVLVVSGKQKCKLNENLPAKVEFGIIINGKLHSITDEKGGIRFDTLKEYIGLPEGEYRRLANLVSDNGKNPQQGQLRLNVTYDGVVTPFIEKEAQFHGIQVTYIHGEQWVLGNPMIRFMCQ